VNVYIVTESILKTVFYILLTKKGVCVEDNKRAWVEGVFIKLNFYGVFIKLNFYIWQMSVQQTVTGLNYIFTI